MRPYKNTYLFEYRRWLNSCEGEPAPSLTFEVAFPIVLGAAPLVSGNLSEFPDGGSIGEVEVVDDPDRGA